MATKKKKPASPPRCSEATAELRLAELLRIRLAGAQWWDVVEYVKEKVEAKDASGKRIGDPVWGNRMICRAQLFEYLAKVKELIAESCKAERADLIDEQIAVRRELRATAIQQGDTRTALACARDESELRGLYPPRKIAPTTPDGSEPWQPWAPALAALSDEELAVLEKLAERARQVATTDVGPRN
jgi:hypothetical protein